MQSYILHILTLRSCIVHYVLLFIYFTLCTFTLFIFTFIFILCVFILSNFIVHFYSLHFIQKKRFNQKSKLQYFLPYCSSSIWISWMYMDLCSHVWRGIDITQQVTCGIWVYLSSIQHNTLTLYRFVVGSYQVTWSMLIWGLQNWFGYYLNYK